MKNFFQLLTSRWVLTAFGAGTCALMVWFFGPFLETMEGVMPRGAAMLVITSLWLGVNMAIDNARQRTDRALEEGVTKTAGGEAAAARGAQQAAGKEEAAEMRDKLTQAMGLLRQARGKRGYLYEQPWYVFIGPPGAGKTTALRNAGLKFPFAAELGQTEIKGVGGTRMCDWSFTDEAVLIDTAGRYTTQDSDSAVDKAGWEAFLDLLRRTRPRQPLNGIIVAIAIQDVAAAPEAERRAHAQAIRARIKEMDRRFKMRLPIYAVFTKSDLIQGFSDFFDDLDREKRGQVWGTTFALKQEPAGPVGGFTSEFRLLAAQVSARVIDRLQAERSPERRVAIADFPLQFSSLEAPLVEFLETAFGGTRLDPAPFLRGVYFASGTQEGSPIDRLTGVLARSFGIDQQRAPALRGQQGRSYFLERLIKEVVFGEAMLVARDSVSARRRRWLRAGAWATSGAVALGGVLAFWLVARTANNDMARFETAFSAYRQAVEAERLDPVPIGATDLGRVEALLTQARALPFGVTDTAPAGWLELGLSQREQLKAASALVYRRALERMLAPRLVSLVEARMNSERDAAEQLYRSTRVYLTLVGKAALDVAMIRGWAIAELGRLLPGPTDVTARTNLTTHLDALLAQPPAENVALDEALLARSQALIARVGPAARVYSRIQASAAIPALRPFVPADAIGALAAQSFLRRSGVPLSDPVPGFFSLEGFHGVLLAELSKVIRQVADESQALGGALRIDVSDAAAQRRIAQDVVALYTRDYIAAWDKLLDDLDIVPPAGSGAGAGSFGVLTSPEGPIKTLLRAIVAQLKIAEPPPAPPSQPGAAPAAARQPVGPGAPGSAVDEYFRALRSLVEKDELALVLATLDRFQQQLAAQIAGGSRDGSTLGAGSQDPAQPVREIAARTPQPVRRWLEALVGQGNVVRNSTEREQIMAAWRGAGGPEALCQRVVQRFPFRQDSRDDVALDEFAALFAPQPHGRFDLFFSQYLRRYIDTTGAEWRVRDVAGIQAPIAAETAVAFQRAARIREAFFARGGTQAQVSFALRPVSIDSGAKQVQFDFGGLLAKFGDQQMSTAVFDWPGPARMRSVSVTFDPPVIGAELSETGPWALFRFLRKVRPRKLMSEAFHLTINQGERSAIFELTAQSQVTPFAPDLFSGFRCPSIVP